MLVNAMFTEFDGLTYTMSETGKSQVFLASYLLAAALFLYHFLFVPPFTPIQAFAAGDWHFAATPAITMLEKG